METVSAPPDLSPGGRRVVIPLSIKGRWIAEHKISLKVSCLQIEWCAHSNVGGTHTGLLTRVR